MTELSVRRRAAERCALAMHDLRSRVSSIVERRAASRAGFEHVKGWGVFALPFDSGHVLALRVFPENDFAPYVSIWHRDPASRWSIYVDGPRLDTACPRYFGAACERTDYAQIRVEWTASNTVHITMAQPVLDWTVTARSTPILDLLNVIGAAMPLSSWRLPPLVRARELLARALGLGDMRLGGVMPSGHVGLLMPARMYFVDSAAAKFDGVDLGRPVHLRENPRIGGVTLPARGIFAVGQAVWRIRDRTEYERAVLETHAAGRNGPVRAMVSPD